MKFVVKTSRRPVRSSSGCSGNSGAQLASPLRALAYHAIPPSTKLANETFLTGKHKMSELEQLKRNELSWQGTMLFLVFDILGDIRGAHQTPGARAASVALQLLKAPR